MRVFNRVIFVGRRATCREPMAAELLKREPLWQPVEVDAKGIVVLFPEPLNQKAEAVLASHGIKMQDYATSPLEPSDFAPDTLVLTFDQESKDKVQAMEGAQNVYILTDVTGDELEIMDPYGGELIAYGLCYETLTTTIHKLADVLNERTFFANDATKEGDRT